MTLSQICSNEELMQNIVNFFGEIQRKSYLAFSFTKECQKYTGLDVLTSKALKKRAIEAKLLISVSSHKVVFNQDQQIPTYKTIAKLLSVKKQKKILQISL